MILQFTHAFEHSKNRDWRIPLTDISYVKEAIDKTFSMIILKDDRRKIFGLEDLHIEGIPALESLSDLRGRNPALFHSPAKLLQFPHLSDMWTCTEMLIPSEAVKKVVEDHEGTRAFIVVKDEYRTPLGVRGEHLGDVGFQCACSLSDLRTANPHYILPIRAMRAGKGQTLPTSTLG